MNRERRLGESCLQLPELDRPGREAEVVVGDVDQLDLRCATGDAGEQHQCVAGE